MQHRIRIETRTLRLRLTSFSAKHVGCISPFAFNTHIRELRKSMKAGRCHAKHSEIVDYRFIDASVRSSAT